MSFPVRKVLPEVLEDHINSPPTFGLEFSLFCYIANLQYGAENISGLKSVLQLPLLCQLKKKKIYILCFGLLLSLIYYITGAKERKTGHQQRTHLATSYRFPLPASSNYSKKKKKNVFHKWCSRGINCQNVFAEKLFSQKDLILPKK